MGPAILGRFLCNKENPGAGRGLPQGSLKASLGPGSQHKGCCPGGDRHTGGAIPPASTASSAEHWGCTAHPTLRGLRNVRLPDSEYLSPDHDHTAGD